MNTEESRIGFLGAGGIARSHAYSLNSLKYFYNKPPKIVLESVCSATSSSREAFSEQYGFKKSDDIGSFCDNKNINTVFILGPNKVHHKHLEIALEMPSVERIYLEKPVCSNNEELSSILTIVKQHPEIKIQVGFQFLFGAAIREALQLWRSGKFGKTIHFDLKYFHSDYLKKDYRDNRVTRLTSAPDGGAMADLGSHGISILLAFLGDKLKIINALQSGNFEDVIPGSDLFSMLSIYDEESKAVGTLSSSRISSGTGDLFSFELYAEKGAIKFSSLSPDSFDYYFEEYGVWHQKRVGSNYKPVTSFPSGHVPPGWLRSMIHAHYVFLGGDDPISFVPDIGHGIAVQKLLIQSAEFLKYFRESNK